MKEVYVVDEENTVECEWRERERERERERKREREKERFINMNR